MRILTNYFQITLMVRNLKISWPARVEKLLNSLAIMQSLQKDMLQFSCIFKDQEESSFTLTVLLMVILPFVMCGIGFLIWKLAAYLKPARFAETYWRNTMLTSSVIGYLSYPMINSYAF